MASSAPGGLCGKRGGGTGRGVVAAGQKYSYPWARDVMNVTRQLQPTSPSVKIAPTSSSRLREAFCLMVIKYLPGFIK